MQRVRLALLVGLFTLASGVIIAALVIWLKQEQPVFPTDRQGFDAVSLAAVYAALIFTALYSLRIAVYRLIRWAASQNHPHTLLILQHIAPRLTRHALAGALGATLTLSSASMAVAWSPSTTTQHTSAAPPEMSTADEGGYSPKSSTSLPTPRWSAEVINVPMPRIVGGPKRIAKLDETPHSEVVVAKGQTLWHIAGQMLGNQATIAEISELWPRIYDLNRATIGPEPDLLQVGTVLKLPPMA
ncbi:hypothetical protein [Glutamicibacter sp. NPDC087344]|uniref:hypothetical protein n=1 Tax=Glutamicibacter sp. NPDC087344 TaxID=3363994 RepID=UPI0037F49BCA